MYLERRASQVRIAREMVPSIPRPFGVLLKRLV